jgi:RNA polymerase sigma factor (sigma-70 family)
MRLKSKETTHPKSSSTTELFQRYGPAIFTFLCQHISSREDAEDILLDIFTAVLENEHVHSWLEDEQRRWIWRVTKNKMIDAYRKSSRMTKVPLQDEFDDVFTDETYAPEETLLRMEEYAQLRAAVDNLSPLQQKILKLRFVYEMHSAEIAARVGKSEGSVRVLLSRTLNALRSFSKEE